jgi:histone-lysine N-methyltransferase SETMAR
MVYNWVEYFNNGRTTLQDEPRSGRPTTSLTATNVEQADKIIRENRRTTVTEMAEKLGISSTSAYSIIHDTLNFRKVCARWVPKQLTEEHKATRVERCAVFLQQYREEGDTFLKRIVTGDETWVHYYEPESKQQSMSWKHPKSPAPKKLKSTASAGKVLLTVFWDWKGPILEHYQEKGQTVNSERYSVMLESELKPAIRSKRRGMLSTGVILHHDNARPHTAARTIEAVHKMKFVLLPHPPYSPDLAPSDFHLFGPLKGALRGVKFSSDDEVRNAVHSWFAEQPKNFFYDGFSKWVDRCNKCIAVQGDYVEK